MNRCSPKHIYDGSSSRSLEVLVGTSVPPFLSVQGCVFIAILASSHPVPYNSSANVFVIFQNPVSVAKVANSFVIPFPIYGGCKVNFLKLGTLTVSGIWLNICRSRFAESIFYALVSKSLAALSWSL